MADEGTVHDGHPLVRGDTGQCGGGLFGTGGGTDVEPEAAQLVRER
ncbi:hypothetical protein [Streptomyces xanthophaeus]|nr:hypothetical protein [Streptomyces xanthophaeus]WST25610.1 hypothetical protein OG264_31335 [Streptomyces xanthophaeus]WST59415.1 hypothetical protein OG605_07105 [Streptomyces xanthophaeus]